MEYSLEVDRINVKLGGQPILEDFSMCLQPGRIHALLGRNGAGKSTAFRAILGLIELQAGEVRVLGERFKRHSLRHIGASVNGPALYGHLSATDNVRIHALSLGLPKAEVDRVLDAVGLSGAGKKKAKNFSTGMKARLALAIALLGDPKILMLDEPQNGLDPQGIVDLRHMLQSWAEHGGTVLVSSHQLGEITHLAQDLTVLHLGKTAYTGALSDFAPSGQLEQKFLETTMKGTR
ncbi:ATP-binding cassette domain-containing protein [Corynebacterium sp. H128]|uniref:ATP-binding cassette domain-containing protein n=1 Tax=unclassified Corynebacterium TaxID=2624378 RepID=UPI0030B6CC27